MDIVLSTAILALSIPLLVTAALAIKRDDRRSPILYKQQRIGRGGRPFTLYKLRTMGPGAAEQMDELRKLNQRHGPLFKLAKDPRVTAAGRFLRQTSIDELPQLVNVLKGDMSLVGPRPALPAEVANFDPDFRSREAITPGLTGLWQVEARDNPSFSAYRRLDLFYLENWSLLLDIAIIGATVVVVGSRGIEAVIGRMKRSGDSRSVQLD
jgi:lipopolysaccharide/colanic/teichoic acid biosynthesis glycosyltransferase